LIGFLKCKIKAAKRGFRAKGLIVRPERRGKEGEVCNLAAENP